MSCLDWVTGRPNAKYYVTQLLAGTVGTPAEKRIFHSNVSHPGLVYAMPYAINQTRGLLLVNKEEHDMNVTLTGITVGNATVVEVNATSSEPAFESPVHKMVASGGVLRLGPYAVAVVEWPR